MAIDFKPLLASPAENIKYPALASIKIDGIRCCILPHLGAVSRKIKPIPNTYVRNKLNSNPALTYHDGELVTYTDGRMDNFNLVQSKIMSEDGQPDFIYFVFDSFMHPDEVYLSRRAHIAPSNPNWPYYKVVTQLQVHNDEELVDLEQRAIADGWEGLIVRSELGRYKFGRSTEKEGILLKVVRRQRAEAVITDTYERLHNANEAEIDNLGYMKRSSHKDNKIGRGDLGGLCLLWDGMCDGKKAVSETKGFIEFFVGTGMDDTLRSDLWQRREEIVGKTVTFEFRGVGANSKPRFPAFIGFRDEL